INKEYVIEMIEDLGEVEYNLDTYEESEPFLRFLRGKKIHDDIQILRCKSEDFFLLRKGDKNYIVYSYQNSGAYELDDKFVFSGWDDDLIIDLNTMNCITKRKR